MLHACRHCPLPSGGHLPPGPWSAVLPRGGLLMSELAGSTSENAPPVPEPEPAAAGDDLGSGHGDVGSRPAHRRRPQLAEDPRQLE